MHSERHYLRFLFEPDSVALIGASERPHSIGAAILSNMLGSGYEGRLFCVNPGHTRVMDQICHASVEHLPQRVDLAVICTAAARIPRLMESCGKAGIRGVIITSAGFREAGAEGAVLEQKIIATARRFGIRVMGPNCLGLIRPWAGVNLTFARGRVLQGNIGLISQSGALCTAILDWATPNKVGFSTVISLGTEADIHLGEALDYLVSDHRTEHIFLYVEGIRNARRFMSALRAAARTKPVMLIKAGRHPAGERAVLSHTGALVGDDDVFDAAIRRSGVVRLRTVGHLYAAASALFSHFRPHGNRLAIITNGGGPGAMAADHAADIGVPLAHLSAKTLSQLDKVLPAMWPGSNPVDILGDAGPGHFTQALSICLSDSGVDGVLVILTPQAMTDPTRTARLLIEQAAHAHKPVFTCWMGEDQVREARKLFQTAGIPSFRLPEPAVDMFAHISSYYRNQQLLLQVPASLESNHEPPHVESARLVIETALRERRRQLDDMEAKALLAAFHIPIAQTLIAHSADEAVQLAATIGMPAALRLSSFDPTLRAAGGVKRLNLHSANAVRQAYDEILEEASRRWPLASLRGVAIEPMVRKPRGRELMAGVFRDNIFGPTVYIGLGGTEAESRRDRVVALPPLNGFLTRDMLRRDPIARHLGHYRNQPPVDLPALEAILLRVSEMACELPWIQQIEINPLLADERDAVAVRVRIEVAPLPTSIGRYDHMAIHPYPSHLVACFQTQDGIAVQLRPIRPEDAELEQEFVQGLSVEARYFRFMNTIRELSPVQLARLTQIDYDREMAFLATTERDGREHELGVARYATNPDGESCEFAIVLADEWQGKGIAWRMMQVLIDTARRRGLRYMTGEFLAENSRMLAFVNALGFSISTHPEDPGIKRGVLTL
ncbi:MAG: GNAT family N-acetyltransferase [Proteobacteria bacterium]|nr:GNAT family N-acetyltransferase [Pseudomonadota bacterium]HQR04720.1 GNAT family N-acetyltransferase [Rhodocyclaceae bacterium]